MDKQAFSLIKQSLLETASISRTYLMRKLKITDSEAVRLIHEFLIDSNVMVCQNCRRIMQDIHSFTYDKPKHSRNMIVVIGGTKGGVGKSTIALNLVIMLTLSGRKVLLVDADRIRSSSKFVEHRLNKQIITPWRTICLQNNLVSAETLNLKKDFDEIVIDAGGGDTASQRHALGIADLFIMPFNPAFPDLETLEEMRQIITLAKPFNPRLRVAALLNQADSRGRINEQGRRILEREPVIHQVFNTVITRRVSIRNAWSSGLGIIERNPQDQKAVTEFTNLYGEIYDQKTAGTGDLKEVPTGAGHT